MKKVMSIANIDTLRERSKVLAEVILQTAKERDMDTTGFDFSEVMTALEESEQAQLILLTLELVRLYEEMTGESASFLFDDIDENVTVH
jgi:hypothetical protein